MVINERNSRIELLESAARQMMAAARTAPKSKGIDIIEIATVTGDDITKLSEAMVKTADRVGLKFFYRDAENLMQAGAVVFIGTKFATHGLNCGYCGFTTCEKKLKHKNIPCALNTTDVGIAIGSACAVASDMKIDTRVMFSAGFCAKEIGVLADCSNVYAIPLSVSSKNPFFDRKPKEIQ